MQKREMFVYRDHEGKHESHRKHRNVLYSLVILLAIIQISSLVILSAQMSAQISKINTKIDSEIQKTEKELEDFSKGYATNLVNEHDLLYQQSFNEITNVLAKQQESFEEELDILKSTTQTDFSGVVEDAAKGVVAVSTERSIGTGFLISAEGYIVTNYHIVYGSEDKVAVRTYDRRGVSARFIGKDELRDVALLKIDGNYDSLELANSNSLRVGEKVIAIGNPLGLSFTVTGGIISALDRLGPNGLNEYIQTDVSLNPGNSGGPLINTQGKVIGINNFKIGGAESLGFALESNSIRKSVNDIANMTLVS